MSSKRRYNAKKIAKTPSLKKKLALFIAERTQPDKSVVELMAYGHRGLISYDEKQLCKMFDKLYAEQLEIIQVGKQKIEAYIKEHGDKTWQVENMKEKLATLEKSLSPYEDIAGDLFEENVLK